MNKQTNNTNTASNHMNTTAHHANTIPITTTITPHSIERIDHRFHYHTYFNRKNGLYVRSGKYVNGKETNIDPFRASFPHLIDIGIMGSCTHGLSGLCQAAGTGCYQNGSNIISPHMSLADFTRIAQECSGYVDQFALGGRGDPNEHPDFEAILQVCDEYSIVPNYTTSGYTLTPEQVLLSKKYCGSVAVSWYRSDYTIKAIELLLRNDVKTNIHYVLSKDTIEEAIENIRSGGFPNVNAIIFLLHKPKGLGRGDLVLDIKDQRVTEFFSLIAQDSKYRFGVDSCTIPGILNSGSNFNMKSLDTCEAARFSCYIGPNLIMVPCSFDTEGKYAIDLHDTSIFDAYNSALFDVFRKKLRNSCTSCQIQKECLGGCPLMPQIVLCQREEKMNG